MFRRFREFAFVSSTSVLLCSCGNSMWSASSNLDIPPNLDGAVLSYAMAQGEVSFSAEYTNKRLLLSSDQKMTATPDYGAMFKVVYDHNSFSSDDIEIQMDGALVKSLSSSTEDRSIAVVQSVTALLTQAGATQKDLEKSRVFSNFIADTPAMPPCSDMKAVAQKDITNNRRHRTTITQLGEPSCSIRFAIEVKSHPDKVLSFNGFIPQNDIGTNPDQVCNFSFCFRRAGLFSVKGYAKLVQKGQNGEKTLATTPPVSFQVLAPVASELGFVRFNRRAFVKNKTVISFNNGILSGFSASNPSEVVGAVQLPSELLKGVSAAFLIH
ncbi:hypothetical protein [Rhodopseudomonas palustris]|nr:hypothetical protein [Rhodopseudomonas palustris]